MTYRLPVIRQITPSISVEVSPEYARECNLESGSIVNLRSRHGEVSVPIVVTDRAERNQLCMPMNSIGQPVTRLTSSNVDRTTHTPAFKELSAT